MTDAQGFPATAAEMLDVAEAAPASPALEVGGARLSYAELHRRATAAGCGLLRAGLEPGDRVAIWMPNSVEWVVAYLGCLLTGLVVVPVNARHRERDFDHTLRHSGARALVTRDLFFGQFPALEHLWQWAGGDGPEAWRARWPNLDLVVVCGEAGVGARLTDIEAAGSGAPRPPAPSAESRAVIQYTSGTTGAPKGASLLQRNLVGVACRVAARLGMTAGDRFVCPLPFFHIGGLVLGLLVPFSRGAFAISMERFAPGAMLDLLESRQATMVGALETMYLDLIAAQREHPRHLKLRGGFGAGSAGTMRRAREALGIESLVNIYGMTETGPTMSMAEWSAEWRVRTDTVGRPLPGVELRLVDPTTGETIIEPRRDGEIQVRGFSVMEGYHDDPEATRAAFVDGWLRTGDLACLDADGNLVFKTRIRNLIRVGGESFGPQEVEDTIEMLPGVRRAGVLGVLDERLGEIPWALVEVQEDVALDEQSVRSWCRGKIADFKIPRRVFFVDEVPLGPSGKLERKALPSLAAALAAGPTSRSESNRQ